MTKPSSTYNTGLILKALAFAADKHRDQKRKGVEASPYINHPIAVADVLCNEGGITDENVLCAALLHDTVEDTKTTPEELTQVFGKVISGIVMEVTDNKKIAKAKRKQLQIEHAAHASHQAKLVKLADKISNLRDIITNPPEGWDLKRKEEYFNWASEVIDKVRGTNANLEMIFDSIYMKGPEPKKGIFTLVGVAPFDARQGYKRCTTPVVGVHLGEEQSADSDFWRDKTGKVYVRITSSGYVYDYQAMRIDGKQLSESDMGELADYMVQVLHDWMVEAVDVSPEETESI